MTITGLIRSEWTAACISSHLGVWAMMPDRLNALAKGVLAGTIVPNAGKLEKLNARRNGGDDPDTIREEAEREKLSRYMRLTNDGLAVIELVGVMQKGESKYDGVASTVRVRRALRMASQSDLVRGALLLVDSPGGTADGTLELAEDIAAFGRGKPIGAFVDGTMASAALWAGVQALRVSADRGALIGSIGTYAVVEDLSKMAEMEGVVVHVIAAGGIEDGGVKGQGVPGTEISEEYLDEVRKVVNGFNGLFVEGVAKGRKMKIDQVKKLADGRVHLASEAMKLGLIDAVESADRAAAAVLAMAQQAPRPTTLRNLARARLDLDRA